MLLKKLFQVALLYVGFFGLSQSALAEEVTGQLLSTCIVKSQKTSFYWSLERAQIGMKAGDKVSWFDVASGSVQQGTSGMTDYVFTDFFGAQLLISTNKVNKAQYKVAGADLVCQNNATLNPRALDDASKFSQSWVQPEQAVLAFQCAITSTSGEDTMIQLFNEVATQGTVTLVRGETGFVNRKVLGAVAVPQQPNATTRVYKFNFGGGMNLLLTLPISDDTSFPLASIVLDGKTAACVSNQYFEYPALDKIVNSVVP